MHTLRLRALVVSTLGLALSGSSAQSNPAVPSLFTPATVSRAQKLLGQMTTEEKIGQMTQLFVFDRNAASDTKLTDRIKAGRLGSALFVTDPVLINALQHVAVENSRLHIPLIYGFDVIHGFKTIFPVPLAMAASWDPDGAVRAQTIAAAEARSVGIAWAFAPMLDIARDPRWGRIVEGAGEDPYLGAAMARGQVRGFQGPAIGTPDHVLACAKHFAGYGAAEGGRDYDASYISDAQMQNVYLPPFHAAVDAGVGSLMSAYMDLNDIPATGNKFLMTDTLRTQWGFKGFVVSDADAVKSLEKHGFASDPEDSAVRALNAGLSMEMAQGTPAFDNLQVALAEHKVTLAQVDAAVLPILEAKIQLGLFEHPYADIPRSVQVLADPAHRVEALHAAERSAVLLRNEGELLPLAKGKYKTIAVIGPTGDSGPEMTGSWTFIQDDAETVTIAAGLRAKFGSEAQVTFAPGVQIKRNTPSIFDQIFHTTTQEPGSPNGPWNEERTKQEFDKAVALAGSSDLVILTLGELRFMSGEQASRSSLDLPGDQEELLEAVAALGKPVVLVLSNGRPLNIVWANDHIPAILEAWYPGTQGGAAVANLLTGDAVPGGKLPLAWPRNVGQIPINYAHNLTQDASKQAERYWNEPSTPLFPFGYGLSYSTFAFSNLAVNNSQTGGEATSVGQAARQSGKQQLVQVSVDVENSGTVAADEVVQIYIHQQAGRASRPVRELKGFRRITLAPHQKQTVHFTLGSPELRYWNAATRTWVEDQGTLDLWAGGDSAADLHTTFSR